ncbi:MAG: DNA mismatch repair endonuclease MutL [Thermodesulforhabdaceae bacterium]
MGKIRILPDALCHHIAAGEVVERPAAVVKELMENSLDAGSSHIIVSYERGGIKFISVVDNGEGMDREDALLALERHATSKIKTVDDLHRISSYGFRGEALASIAAVSRFELITKTSEEDVGTRVYAEGGTLKSVEPVGCPVGCSVTVSDLFFNVPARRKFLKSENTERQHILDQFRRLAISNPLVHFELYEGKKPLFNYPATSDLRERISQVFGLKASQSLISFQLARDGTAVRGYLGDPSLGRPTPISIFLFINGRPFRDALIQKVIRDSCRSFVPEGIFPFVVLFIEMNPQDVDVNVHPTKQEVRFKNTGAIIALIKDAIMEGRTGHEKKSPFLLAPLLDASISTTSASHSGICLNEEPKAQILISTSFRESKEDLPLPTEKFDFSPFTTNLHSSEEKDIPLLDPEITERKNTLPPPVTSSQPAKNKLELPSLTVLGVINNTYIVCSSPSGLVLIDFHAAHERIIYNRLISQSLPLPSQQLAIPFLLSLLPEEVEMIESRRSDLRLLGYEVEPFGTDSVAVRAVPAVDTGIRHEDILGEIIRTGLDETQSQEARLLERFASTVACHRALRAGTPINRETISWLMDELHRNPQVLTCPHGRPAWIIITEQEIARRFGRSL